MYGSDGVSGDTDSTAFRRAEKKYKLYYDLNSKSSKKKKQPKPVDLSDVLDFKSLSDSYNNNFELPLGVLALYSGFNRPVFGLENRPGFYFIPEALSISEQCRWIKESLTNFPQPPNRTNHNAIYGPIQDLFIASKEGRVLVKDDVSCANFDIECNTCTDTTEAYKWTSDGEHLSSQKTCKSVSAKVLLRKLRWSTLGLQFDWSKRNYNVELPHNKIPDDLCCLAKRLSTPAIPNGEKFQPEAAIVNYFGLGDTLGGHLDDMEADWSKPIVSMSLGCKAIFLLGGKSRNDPPLAMFLRSGDVVLMSGEARECFHGVPRIFIDKENAEISRLELELSDEEDYLDYMRTSRININIRQVF